MSCVDNRPLSFDACTRLIEVKNNYFIVGGWSPFAAESRLCVCWVLICGVADLIDVYRFNRVCCIPTILSKTL